DAGKVHGTSSGAGQALTAKVTRDMHVNVPADAEGTTAGQATQGPGGRGKARNGQRTQERNGTALGDAGQERKGQQTRKARTAQLERDKAKEGHRTRTGTERPRGRVKARNRPEDAKTGTATAQRTGDHARNGQRSHNESNFQLYS
ncbi:unnamed protein product, partial [Lota lota]